MDTNENNQKSQDIFTDIHYILQVWESNRDALTLDYPEFNI